VRYHDLTRPKLVK